MTLETKERINILCDDIEDALNESSDELDIAKLGEDEAFIQVFSDYFKSASSLEECFENYYILNILEKKEIKSETIREAYIETIQGYAKDEWIVYASNMYDRTGFYVEPLVADIHEDITSYVEANETPISYEYDIRYMYQLESWREENGHEIEYYGDFAIDTQTIESNNADGKLQISISRMESNSVSTICHATIKNNSENTYRFLEVKGAFTDVSGDVVETAWTYAVGGEGLAPGESINFEIYADRNSAVADCRITVIDLPSSEYVTNSTYEEDIKMISDYWFHHTRYKSAPATIAEVEEYQTLSEEEKIYRLALFVSQESTTEALELLKTLPEGYSKSK